MIKTALALKDYLVRSQASKVPSVLTSIRDCKH